MAIGGHVMDFTSDGKLFASINDQGILRIWDTEANELKQEYTPNLHLAKPCTALKWVLIKQNKKAGKSPKVHDNATKYIIVMGTSNGKVSLYSYSQGKIDRNLNGEGHNGGVTSVVYDGESYIYTCGEDCQVIMWSLTDEKQVAVWSVGSEKPHSLALLPHSSALVVGTRQLKVYNVKTHELLQTLTGHNSEVNLMTAFTTSNGENFAVTSSRLERIICLWKISGKGRNKTAACTMLMEDIAVCLTCHADADGQLKVAAVTRNGVIHIYLVNTTSLKAEKPLKPKVSIEIASNNDSTALERLPAVAASLENCGDSQELLFGYGERQFLMFENHKLTFDEKNQYLARTDPKTLLSKKTDTKKSAGTQDSLKTLTPVINAADVAYKSSLTVSRKKQKSVELPMESRLENLNLNTPAGGVVVQAQSKVQLLVQALHSKDATLLRSVLCTNDIKTIQLTLQKLPVRYVGTLVNELTQAMQQKRQNVEFAVNWLKILVQTHSSQLMALGADDLLNKFGPCMGIIDHRVNCLREVTKLSGRLQLLLSQIKRNVVDEMLNTENVVVYEDVHEDSTPSPSNDFYPKSESDDEWEEDGDAVPMDEDEDDEDEEVQQLEMEEDSN